MEWSWFRGTKLYICIFLRGISHATKYFCSYFVHKLIVDDNANLIMLKYVEHEKGGSKKRGKTSLPILFAFKSNLGWLVVGFKSDCPLKGPVTIDGMPSVKVFL